MPSLNESIDKRTMNEEAVHLGSFFFFFELNLVFHRC